MLTTPDPSGWVLFLAAFLVGTLAVARVTRLIAEDDFPPILWLRTRWDKVTHDSDWGILLTCPFCLSFWISLADLLWAWFTLLQPAWWFVNLAFAVPYVAAMVVVRDLPADQRDSLDK